MKLESVVSNSTTEATPWQQLMQIARERQPFERLELTREEALEMFNYSKFKTDTILTKATI